MGNRDSAVKLYNQAILAANDKSKPSNPTTAYQLFASACMVDPTFGEAHYQYGNNQFDLKNLSAAVAAYRRALNCDITDKTRACCLANLGWCFHLLGDTGTAIEVTHRALDMDQGLTQGWMHLSVLRGLLGKTKDSVVAAETAVGWAEHEVSQAELSDSLEDRDNTLHGLRRQLLECRIALAFALLFDGQYSRAFPLFELRFEWRLHNFLHMPYRKWVGEAGRTVFLISDQGLGDTLSYARFLPLVCERSKHVHAMVHPELFRIFLHSFGHIANLNLIPLSGVYPHADAWTTFVSLPFALGLTDDLVRNTKSVKSPLFPLPTTWMIPDAQIHIGIAWAGSPLNDIDQHRNIPIRHFLELYRVPGVQLYSLQVGERSKDLHESGCVALIRDLAPYIHDVADTVALLNNLDLVICCESALGHICAMVDRECWVAYSYLGRDYRIGHTGDKLLWTPKHRIFQQGVDAHWESVFENIVQALVTMTRREK